MGQATIGQQEQLFAQKLANLFPATELAVVSLSTFAGLFEGRSLCLMDWMEVMGSRPEPGQKCARSAGNTKPRQGTISGHGIDGAADPPWLDANRGD